MAAKDPQPDNVSPDQASEDTAEATHRRPIATPNPALLRTSGQGGAGRDQALLDVYLVEYFKLKDEQCKRIEFRDKMIEVTLVAVGSVAAFAMHQRLYDALLIIPWVCLVMGWTYLFNDDRISAIGSYLRHELTDRVNTLFVTATTGVFDKATTGVFEWEVVHRNDPARTSRKLWQLLVDQITFVASSLSAVIAFATFSPSITNFSRIAMAAEVILICILSVKIVTSTDFKHGR